MNEQTDEVYCAIESFYRYCARPGYFESYHPVQMCILWMGEASYDSDNFFESTALYLAPELKEIENDHLYWVSLQEFVADYNPEMFLTAQKNLCRLFLLEQNFFGDMTDYRNDPSDFELVNKPFEGVW